MGTRADFYIKENKELKWMGSVGWDGYEWAEEKDCALMQAKTEKDFMAELKEISKRDDFTAVKDGWPWPWDDSNTTDYAYIFTGEGVDVYSFGEPKNGSPKINFPDMKHIQKVDFGARSGLMIISHKGK
jgi:hypothetical protein